MTTDDGGSVFPKAASTAYSHSNAKVIGVAGNVGLTVRDYFAAKAMQAFIQGGTLKGAMEAMIERGDNPGAAKGSTCGAAFASADAMLKARAE